MASLNAVVSTGDRPAALALSGIICQSTESVFLHPSFPPLISVTKEYPEEQILQPYPPTYLYPSVQIVQPEAPALEVDPVGQLVQLDAPVPE